MSDKKYVVPEGMKQAARDGLGHGSGLVDSIQMYIILSEAIRWLAENPVIPTDEQASDMWRTVGAGKADERYRIQSYLAEWQRICFLAPEPGVPDAVKDFLWGDWEHSHGVPGAANGWLPIESHNAQVLEAYNRGKAGK